VRVLRWVAAGTFLVCLAAFHEGVRDWLVWGLAVAAFVIACWAIASMAASVRGARPDTTAPAGDDLPDAHVPSVRTSPAGPTSQETTMPTTSDRPALTLPVVRHVLWHFGDQGLGQQPGHFVSRLLTLAASADPDNLDKLRNEWPEYITAFEAVRDTPWGLDWLRGIAKADLDHHDRGLDFSAVAS
jgi:hypothetical protein